MFGGVLSADRAQRWLSAYTRSKSARALLTESGSRPGREPEMRHCGNDRLQTARPASPESGWPIRDRFVKKNQVNTRVQVWSFAGNGAVLSTDAGRTVQRRRAQ